MGDGKMVAVVGETSGAAMDRVRELQAQGVHAVTLCSPMAVESAVYQASTLGLRLQLQALEGACNRGDWQAMQWALLAHGITKTVDGTPLEPVREREVCGGSDGLSLAERAVLESLASMLESESCAAARFSLNIFDEVAVARVLRKAAAL
jgi:hypothetical protein